MKKYLLMCGFTSLTILFSASFIAQNQNEKSNSLKPVDPVDVQINIASQKFEEKATDVSKRDTVQLQKLDKLNKIANKRKPVIIRKTDKLLIAGDSAGPLLINGVVADDYFSNEPCDCPPPDTVYYKGPNLFQKLFPKIFKFKKPGN